MAETKVGKHCEIIKNYENTMGPQTLLSTKSGWKSKQEGFVAKVLKDLANITIIIASAGHLQTTIGSTQLRRQ